MQREIGSSKSHSRYETGLLGLAGFCIGFFLAVRLQAFLQQAWGVLPGRAFLWGFVLALVAAALLFRTPLRRAWAGADIPQRAALAIAALSLLFCLGLRRLVIDRAVLGADVQVGGPRRAVLIAGAALLLALFLCALGRGLGGIWKGIRRWAGRLTRRDLLYAAVLFVVLNFLSTFYIKNSSTIYFWDNAGYWSIARTLTALSDQGAAATLRAVYSSVLTADYNALIVLPFVPIFKAFGASRLVFVLAVTDLYLFPLFLLVHGLAKRHGRHPGAAALCASCSVPMLLYLSLLGFVDVGGTFFALAATALCLEPSAPREMPYWRYVLAGCFLAIAVLLRRWYAFFALSFVLAQLLSSLLFRRPVSRVLWTAGSFAFVLLFFFQPMVSGLLLANYAAAYSAYSMAIGTDFLLLFRYFGLFTLLLAALSFFLCLRKERSRFNAVLLLAQACLCFFLFTRVQTHGQQHLLLYVPAVILALSALYSVLLEQPRRQKIALAAAALSALLPALSPFAPRQQPQSISEIRSAAVLPAFSYTPPKRSDAQEIVRLVRYLDETVGARGKSLGVLASSFVLNDDILKNAEDSLSLPRISAIPRDYIRVLPAVDSRDSFPGALFDCDYLLVASPVQLHLGESRQKVVAIPAGEVLEGEGFGAAFCPTDRTFSVGDGSVTVRLYEKLRPITPAEKAALEAKVKASGSGA